MHKNMKSLSFLVLACSSMGLSTLAFAQQSMEGKDPARWKAEDTTPKARSQTLKKEADAAYRENVKQCKTLSTAERSGCMKEAQSNHKQDLANAKLELKQ